MKIPNMDYKTLVSGQKYWKANYMTDEQCERSLEILLKMHKQGYTFHIDFTQVEYEIFNKLWNEQ
jgi:hypothetical protein